MTDSLDVKFASMQRDMHHMREKMDELLEEVRESHRVIKAEHSALELRVRALEEERIRIRTMLIPISVIISALLSYGIQQASENIFVQPNTIARGK